MTSLHEFIGKHFSKDGSVEIFARSLGEDKLEYELDEYRRECENAEREFEENITNNQNVNPDEDNGFLEPNNDGLLNLFIKNNDYEISVIKVESTDNLKSSKTFVIPRNGEIIESIYLELDLPESFETLNSDQKCIILHMTVQLIITGQHLLTTELITNLIQQICLGYKINEYDNKLQIPLFSFHTFDTFKKDFKLNGLPITALQYSEIKIALSYDTSFLIPMRLVVKYYFMQLNSRSYMIRNYFTFLIFQSQQSMYIVKYPIEDIKFSYGFNHDVKFLMIYFDQESSNDIEFNKPIISSINLNLDSETIRFTSEDILTMEILGISMYLLPLYQELNSWEKISKCLKDPSNMPKSIINFSKIDKQSLSIQFENDYEECFIHIVCINMNGIVIHNGMVSLLYYD